MKKILSVLSIVLAFSLIFSISITFSAIDNLIPFVDKIPEKYLNEGSKYNESVQGHYNKVVNYVYSNNYMIGTSNELFSPETNVTRGMFITVLMRITKDKLVLDSINSNFKNAKMFPDVKQNSYYYESIKTAKNAGLVYGDQYGLFYPDENITNEWAMAVVGRLVEVFSGIDRSEVLKNAKENFDKLKSIPIWNTPDFNKLSQWAIPDVSFFYCYYNNFFSGDTLDSFYNIFGLQPAVRYDLNSSKKYAFVHFHNEEYKFDNYISRIEIADYIYFFCYFTKDPSETADENT